MAEAHYRAKTSGGARIVRQPDQVKVAQKRRPCAGPCGLPIERGDHVFIERTTKASYCTDCYAAKDGT